MNLEETAKWLEKEIDLLDAELRQATRTDLSPDYIEQLAVGRNGVLVAKATLQAKLADVRMTIFSMKLVSDLGATGPA